MTTPESGPGPQPESDAEDYALLGEELTFGELARARSEALLLKHGTSEQTPEGEVRTVYRWRVGWDWHKQFTLSRPAALPVTPETIYSLEYRTLDTSQDNGRYDFSERQGLLETSEIAYKQLAETMAEQYGRDPATVHEEDLLDCLSSEAKKDTGF